MIRRHAQDFIVCEDNNWKFMDPIFQDGISMDFIELTEVEAKLWVQKELSIKSSRAEAIIEFAKVFFSEPEGHLSYRDRKEDEWAKSLEI